MRACTSKLLALSLCLGLLGCDKRAPAAQPQSQPSAASETPVASAASPAEKPAAVAAEAGPPTAAGLRYHEVIVGDANPSDPLPMVIAIHGLGDRPDNFVHVFSGWGGRARLILPEGIDPTEDGGYSWFPTRARSQDVDTLAAEISGSAKKIADAISQLQRDRPTVGKPVVTGFSQGGMLTFALAIEHPDVVGNAVAVGGWLPPPLWPKSKDDRKYPPLVALHGTADVAVRYQPTADAVDHLKGLGFDVTLLSYEGVGHAIPPPVRRDLFDRLTDAAAAQAQHAAP